jgi:hypothetical protein
MTAFVPIGSAKHRDLMALSMLSSPDALIGFDQLRMLIGRIDPANTCGLQLDPSGPGLGTTHGLGWASCRRDSQALSC